jgi:hypothetical protein
MGCKKYAQTLLAPALVAGLAALAVGSHVLMAQSAPITRTMLQQKDLEGVAGREVVMYRAEIAPGVRWGSIFTLGLS